MSIDFQGRDCLVLSTSVRKRAGEENKNLHISRVGTRDSEKVHTILEKFMRTPFC